MDRILYCSDVRDPISGGPVYIFDTSYLPPTDSINYDMFIQVLVSHLPLEPYVLVMFSCGLNKISWVWGLKFLKLFLGDNDNNIRKLTKVVTVHDSWFVRSVTQIVSNYNSTRRSISSVNKLIETFKVELPFSTSSEAGPKIINCKNLYELSHYTEITKLKISLNVYKYDVWQEGPLVLAKRPCQLLHQYTRVNADTDPAFFHHFYQIFHIIDTHGTRAELLFHKPGNKINTDIFFACINRDQHFWINDWDMYCIGAVFKRFLAELPQAMINVDLITEPVFDLDTAALAVKRLMDSYEPKSNFLVVFVQLFDLMHRLVLNTKTTKHTPATLAKCMVHCLSHEGRKNNTGRLQTAIVTIKSILEHWAKIRITYRGFASISQTILSAQSDEGLDESYETSHDLSLNEEADESRVAMNTSTILDLEVGLGPWKEEDENDEEYETQKQQTEEENCIQEETPNVPHKLLQAPEWKPEARVPHKPRHLLDVSNIAQPQFPPQKYKFATSIRQHTEEAPLVPSKKPVIRGRKVAHLASLFEERTAGFSILENM